MWASLKTAFSGVCPFLKAAFSEGGAPSSARLMMGLSTLFACGWVTHIVWHYHALPDALTMGGLVAFTTASFAVGKFTQK